MNILKEIQCSTQHNPFNAIFIPFAERLPDSFLLWSLASNADTSTTTVGPRRVLLNLAKLDTLRRYVVSSISKVEHAPESSIRIGLRDLEEREIRAVWGRERQFVDRRQYSGVGYRPLEVPRRFTAHDAGARGRMTRIRC